jgi:hypothetical protein
LIGKALILATLAGALLCGAVVLGAARDLFGPKQEPFDSEGWREAPRAFFGYATRKRMYQDLVAKHPLVGQERATLEALLGPPDPEPYLLVEQPRHRGAHIYRLGPNFTDDDWLVIHFDETGKVGSAAVVSD